MRKCVCGADGGLCFVDTWGKEIPDLVVEHMRRVLVVLGARGATRREAFNGPLFAGLSRENRDYALHMLEHRGAIVWQRVGTGRGRPRWAWVAV